MKRLWSGDVAPLVGRLERQLVRAEEAAAAQDLGPKQAQLSREIGVIAGVALTMLAFKAVKILPSIPFAPGHKLVLLTPLYIVARILGRGRFTSTLTGLTMGSVAFLMGDGRYGIFEILKHVVPGVLCDLFVPLLLAGGRRPGPIAWSVFGGFLAVGRFATVFAVTAAVQAPAIAYAILIPGLTAYVVAGVLSGYVTYHLAGAALQLRDERSVDDTN